MTRRRVAAAGTVGSALVGLGGWGVGALPGAGATPGPDWLHATTAGLVVSGLLVLSGVLLLLGAWWRLGAGPLGPPTAREAATATALWAAPLLLAPPLLSRDLYAYAGQAAVLLAGEDPYAVGPEAVAGPLADEVDPVWADDPSPYGPLYVWLAARTVAVTGSTPLLATAGLRLLAVVGVVLVAVSLHRLARACGVDPGQAMWLGLANPLLLLHGVGGGHNDVLMLGLLVAGLALAAGAGPSWRLALAAAAVTGGALVKLPALAALAYLPLVAATGREARLRAGAVVAGGAAATVGVVVAVTGLGFGWLGALGGGTQRLSLLSPTTGLGVAAGEALERLGVVADAGDVLQAVQAAGVVASLALAGWLLLRADRVGPVRALSGTLLVVVLLAPVVQPWYLLWGLVPLAAAAGPRAVPPLAAASMALCLLVLPSGRHLVRPPLYGVPLLLVGAVAGLALLRSRSAAGSRPAARSEVPA